MNKDAEAVCQETTPVAERANMLYSGCFVSAGNGQMLVTGVGNNTEFGQIAQELSSIEKTTTPLQEKLDKLGKQITVLGAAPEEEATVLFTLFVLFQLFNAFNCRELDDTPMCKNLLKNKLMLGVFLLVLILQIIITQFGAAVFETVSLSVGMWGKMLLTAFTVIILNEVVKAVKRLFGRK